MVLRLKLLAAEVEQLAEEAYMPHTAHGCGQQDANHKIIINVNTKNKNNKHKKERIQDGFVESTTSCSHVVRPHDNWMPTKNNNKQKHQK